MCGDSNRIAPLKNLKCLKPGLRRFYFFEADPQIFLQHSYVKAEGKSLSSSIPLPKLYICYICVTLMYLLYIYVYIYMYIYIRSIAFMWHRLWPDCTYMWHVCDVWRTVYVGYVIIWGKYVTYLICSFVRFHGQLVVISHPTHMMCIFSFLCNARCICIWFIAIVFKIFFH